VEFSGHFPLFSHFSDQRSAVSLSKDRQTGKFAEILFYLYIIDIINIKVSVRWNFPVISRFFPASMINANFSGF
jgi:hypothetical protein